MTPFLKWAGGKRWLTDSYAEIFETKYNRYIEPFLGSGAVFFKLLPHKAILSDLNADLIDTYVAIKEDWEAVEAKLKRHHKNHSKDYYYRVRAQNLRSLSSKAARFIYLNRTCWNGLYRVNLNGQFNVPMGTKTKVLLSTDNFQAISSSLQSTQLKNCDFEDTINLAKKGDLVFVDPPYTVNHNLNGFLQYNEKIFSWQDQERLKESIKKAVKRGAKVILTNANHKSVSHLYKGIGTHLTLERSSIIAGKSEYRGMTDELIIKTWKES